MVHSRETSSDWSWGMISGSDRGHRSTVLDPGGSTWPLHVMTQSWRVGVAWSNNHANNHGVHNTRGSAGLLWCLFHVCFINMRWTPCIQSNHGSKNMDYLSSHVIRSSISIANQNCQRMLDTLDPHENLRSWRPLVDQPDTLDRFGSRLVLYDISEYVSFLIATQKKIEKYTFLLN